jgi:predicted NBD/HSP70 family sugar kinase
MNRSSANHLAIIKELYYLNNATCLDISKATGASIPNVAKNINELIEAGYIVQNGFATSTGGRKPLTYSLVSDRKYILSIATDQFFTRICLVDLHNNFLTDVYEFPLDLAVHPSPERELVDQIESYLTQHRIDRTKIYGLGMATPGFVSPDQGVNQTFFKAAKPNLQRFLATETGFDVFIDNDSSAIALAELKFGEGRVKNELMVINIGWGIGLGMIINGEIFRGSTGFAGEFSHIPLFKNGKKCSCGKYGCLETEASLIILEEKAHQQLEPGHGSVNSVLAAAGNGDAAAINLISGAAYNIGQGIAVLIHIMNPEAIVLSGKGIKAGKIWLAPIQQAINEFCIPALTNDIEVKLSSLGTNAQLIGAAALTIEKISDSFFDTYKNELTENQ